MFLQHLELKGVTVGLSGMQEGEQATSPCVPALGRSQGSTSVVKVEAAAARAEDGRPCVSSLGLHSKMSMQDHVP